MSNDFQNQLNHLIQHKNDFILIRKPAQTCIELRWNETNEGEEGFVFRNFDNNQSIIWKQNKPSVISMDEFNFPIDLSLGISTNNESISKPNYLELINKTVQELQSDSDCQKIVISRIKEKPHNGIDLSESLQSLHKRYPNAYVYLWHSEANGTWVGASPELLLRENQLIVETVSLAGTKAKSDKWTQKEIKEQALVTDYVATTIQTNHPVKVDGPHTVDAGFFNHLKSYVSTEICQREEIKELLNALHPTPAVCGLPKAMAKEFILTNEGYDRKFYAGFLGWTNQKHSEFFVNLRCAQLFSNVIKLYVGGGIMPDSDAEKEWEETEMKAKTIGELLVYR